MVRKMVRTPLDADANLYWLHRWQGSRRVIGIACLLPDCVKVVPRENAVGRPDSYCSDAHADQASERRNALIAAIKLGQHQLDTTPKHTRGFVRHKVEADVDYLRRVLASYPKVPTKAGAKHNG